MFYMSNNNAVCTSTRIKYTVSTGCEHKKSSSESRILISSADRGNPHTWRNRSANVTFTPNEDGDCIVLSIALNWEQKLHLERMDKLLPSIASEKINLDVSFRKNLKFCLTLRNCILYSSSSYTKYTFNLAVTVKGGIWTRWGCTRATGELGAVRGGSGLGYILCRNRGTRLYGDSRDRALTLQVVDLYFCSDFTMLRILFNSSINVWKLS